MKCPYCNHLKDKVVDSREVGAGDAIRRRRECLSCGRRFTSYERIEEVPYLIIKKDGRRERFDRQTADGRLVVKQRDEEIKNQQELEEQQRQEAEADSSPMMPSSGGKKGRGNRGRRQKKTGLGP